MKVWIGVLLCAVSLNAIAATPRSAHDYYQEILSVHGLNPLATFVCFPVDQPQTFFLMGRSSQFLSSLKAAHKDIDRKTKANFEKLVGSQEVLYWQSFHNGVGVDESLLPRGDTPNEWVLKFDHLGTSNASGWTRVQITWPTLRYRLSVHIDGRPGSADSYGQCQPIPSGD